MGERGGPWWAAASLAVLVRPQLWAVALRQLRRLAPSGWWRHWPPLPLPAQDYLRFRAETMYGDADHPLDPDDVVTWLQWCRSR